MQVFFTTILSPAKDIAGAVSLYFRLLQSICRGRISHLCLLTSCLLSSSLLFAQAPPKQWDKTFGGNNQEHLTSIVATTDGGYLLGGSSLSDISGDKTEANGGSSEFGYPYADYWVVRIDGNGNKLWDRTFGGSEEDNFEAIVATPDGGYLLGGRSYSNVSSDKSEASKGYGDYWVVKIDGSGNKLWDRTLGGNSDDYLSSIVATSDGGYLLGGYSYSEISGDKSESARINEYGNFSTDYWVVKIDGSGNKLWDRTFGGNSDDYLSSMVATPEGGYLLGGAAFSGISGDKSEASKGYGDYWVVKIDGSGKRLWDRTFGGNSDDYLSSMVATPEGGYLLGGYSDSGISGDKTESYRGPSEFGYPEFDYWIVKIDGSGNKLWDRTYGGNSSDALNSIVATSEGGYLLGGPSVSGISGDKTEASRKITDYPTPDFWIVKIDGNGNKEWDKTFGGAEGDHLTNIVTTQDGGYLLGGMSDSNIDGEKSEVSRGGLDYWIVKLGEEVSCGLEMKTYGQGGWGAEPKKNNAAALLYAHFSQLFPQGLVLGDVNAADNCNGYTLRLTSAQAITDFLPSGTKPRALDKNYTNPGKKSYSNVFAAQVVALSLNVSMDKALAGFAPASNLLQDMLITQGPLACKTVGFVLAQANQALAGCGTSYALSQLHEAVSAINESFEKASSSAYVNCSCEQPQTARKGIDNNGLLSKEQVLGNLQMNVYPNPFSAQTSFEFSLAESTQVSLEVYTMMGVKVATLFKAEVEAGRQYRVDFNIAAVKGKSMQSGTYLYCFTTPSQVRHGRLLYLHR